MGQRLFRVSGADLRDPSDMSEVSHAALDAWRDSLVVHLTDIPSQPDPMVYFDGLVEAIGTPHNLAEDATIDDRASQRIGRRWMEVRFDPAIPNAYRHSANGQPLHTDGSYIASFPGATLMFCLRAAPKGGETIFIDGGDLVGILEEKDPSLLRRLEQTVVGHKRTGDARTMPIIRRSDTGDVLLNWNYYCVDPDASKDVRSLVEDFYVFLRDENAVSKACMAVPLQPGEAVVWKDDRVLHGRTPFSASEVSERFIWKCAVAVNQWA